MITGDPMDFARHLVKVSKDRETHRENLLSNKDAWDADSWGRVSQVMFTCVVFLLDAPAFLGKGESVAPLDFESMPDCAGLMAELLLPSEVLAAAVELEGRGFGELVCLLAEGGDLPRILVVWQLVRSGSLGRMDAWVGTKTAPLYRWAEPLAGRAGPARYPQTGGIQLDDKAENFISRFLLPGTPVAHWLDNCSAPDNSAYLWLKPQEAAGG